MKKITNVRHSFDLKHRTLFLLHPEDEQPFICAWCAQYNKTFFKHSSDGIRRGKEQGEMSLGIAMRVACHSHEVLTDSGCLILKDEFFPEGCTCVNKSHLLSEILLQEYLADHEKKS